MELGHFEKHFVKNTRKKARHGKFLEFFQKKVREASSVSPLPLLPNCTAESTCIWLDVEEETTFCNK